MKKVLIFLVMIVVTFGLFQTSAFAAHQYTGCQFNGKIYFERDGTSGGFPNYEKNPKIYDEDGFCIESTGAGSCRIDKKSNQTGILVTFYMVECPIDDYIPLILLVSMGLGSLTIRKNEFTKCLLAKQ